MHHTGACAIYLVNSKLIARENWLVVAGLQNVQVLSRLPFRPFATPLLQVVVVVVVVIGCVVKLLLVFGGVEEIVVALLVDKSRFDQLFRVLFRQRLFIPVTIQLVG